MKKVFSILKNKNFIYQKRFLASIKKFYEKANVIKKNDDTYEISLDKRLLKTPKGKLFEIKNETLAQMIAQEWNSQQKTIETHAMHLTTLVNTQIDNPLNTNQDKLIDELLEHLQTDTLCYRIAEPKELNDFLKDKWDPMIKWFENNFECKMPTTNQVFLEDIPEQTKIIIKNYLSSFKIESLIGFKFVVDNLKSIVLTLALINKKISVEEAVYYSRLEQEFQIERWGSVEWAHDTDLMLLRSRVSSGLLYFILTNEYRNEKLIQKN